MEKECTKCSTVKPLDNYYRDKSKADGRAPKCKDCAKDYYESNKEHSAQYFRDHKERINERIRNRYYNDIEFRINVIMREGLIRCYKKKSIKGGSTSIGTIESLLGITLPEFKLYIESKFEEGMSWNNIGEWHLDHIIPVLSLEKDEYSIEQIQHHTNFQPLWKKDNILKTLTDMEKYWL